MNKKENNIPNAVADKQLETVSGGSYQQVPSLVKSNNLRVSSGDTPKYHVGQTLMIVCNFRYDTFKLPCKVVSVSATRDCGIFYKEFGYTIEITSNVIPGFNGTVHADVYESCLSEA